MALFLPSNCTVGAASMSNTYKNCHHFQYAHCNLDTAFFLLSAAWRRARSGGLLLLLPPAPCGIILANGGDSVKLNVDCIRDILLTVEENTDFSDNFHYSVDEHPNSMYQYLSKYTYDEIIYHVSQCEKSDLISDVSYSDDGEIFTVQDLSPKGHEFLANIRAKTIWNKTKSIAKKVGATSLNAFIQISSNVITEIIKAELHLVP